MTLRSLQERQSDLKLVSSEKIQMNWPDFYCFTAAKFDFACKLQDRQFERSSI